MPVKTGQQRCNREKEPAKGGSSSSGTRAICYLTQVIRASARIACTDQPEIWLEKYAEKSKVEAFRQVT
jgi:hypothetical protein